jgi:hypothetical protein
MCCFFMALVVLGPRAGILIWWLVQPARWNTAFASMSFIWPLLGFLFVPWTTLMFVLVAPLGITGFDWLWLGLGLFADIASYSGSAYKRNQIPGYPSGASSM